MYQLTNIVIVKIGDQLRIIPIEQIIFPRIEQLLRAIPIVDIAKLKIIKGTTKRKNPKTQPAPKSFTMSLKLIVMYSAIDVEMIEITPRTLEISFVLGGFLVLFLFSFTSTGSHHSLIT